MLALAGVTAEMLNVPSATTRLEFVTAPLPDSAKVPV